MAKTLSSASITDGSTVEAWHVTQSIDAFNGVEAYDITISGSLTLSGDTVLTGTASYASTASYAANAGGADTGSLLTTASVSDNTITFTKGDDSTFNITVDTGSAVTTDTGSLLTTASVSDNTITFTKGDASTFNISVNGGTASALTASGELLGLTTASGHIIPASNDLYDLGSAEKKFRDLYLGSNSIYMSGSSGWMTGSWDGTNFKVNNSALVRSAVTSSMAVGSANQAVGTYAMTADPSNGVTGNFSFGAAGATLSSGTVTIDGLSSMLADKILGDTCFVSVTGAGTLSGTGVYRAEVSVAGRITVTEVGGTSSDNITVQVIAVV